MATFTTPTGTLTALDNSSIANTDNSSVIKERLIKGFNIDNKDEDLSSLRYH